MIVEEIKDFEDLECLFCGMLSYDTLVITFKRAKKFDLVLNGYALNSSAEVFMYEIPEEFSDTLDLRPNWYRFYTKQNLLEALERYIREHHEANEITILDKIKRYTLTGFIDRIVHALKPKTRINRKVIKSMENGLNEYLIKSDDYKTKEEVIYILELIKIELIKKLKELDDNFGQLDFDEEQFF